MHKETESGFITPENTEPVQKEEFDQLEQVVKKLSSYMEFTKQQFPEKPNFKTEIEEGERVDVILKQEGKEPERMSNFLPRSAAFRIGKKFVYDTPTNEVRFPRENSDSIVFFPVLTHEIGHSYQKESHPTPLLRALASGVKDFFSAVAEKHRPDTDEEEQAIQTALAKTFSAFLDKYMQERSQSERNAWASGLRILRALEREGFNVLGGFKDLADFQKFVAADLYRLEAEQLMEKARIGTLPTEGERERLFVKRSGYYRKKQ